MISKFAYILIGDDRTGKTTFQKYLIWHLCGIDKFDKLNTNLVHQINHRNAPRKLKTLSTINRSIQEKMDTYESIDNYFNNYFRDADIAIVSSHSHPPSVDEIKQMMEHLNKRYYNVCSVFFANQLNTNTQEIANLNWSEKIIIDNPLNDGNWEKQIDDGANYFAQMIIQKSQQF